MTRSPRYSGYRFGSFVLDLEQEALLASDGKELPLRPKSFALLRLFVENAGRLLSHDMILEALWPNVSVTENSVTQCIHDIRRALGSEADRTIRTRPRCGYLFTACVTALPAPNPTQGVNHIIDSVAALLRPGTARYTSAEPAGFSQAPSRTLSGLADHPPLPADIFTDLAEHLVNIVVASSEALRRNRHAASLQDVAREAGMSNLLQGSIQGIVSRLAHFDQSAQSAC
jgi:DNA-binding winged helix-turn-helix (wHTH) protein